jgi:hypothetical protein
LAAHKREYSNISHICAAQAILPTEEVAMSFEIPQAMHHCTWMKGRIFHDDPGRVWDLLKSSRFSHPLRAHRDPNPLRHEAGTARLNRDCLGL